MKRLCGIFALLVLATLSNGQEVNKKSKSRIRNRCTTSKLTYLDDSCECGAMEMTAALKVKARTRNAKKPAVMLTSVMDVSGSMKEAMELMQKTNTFMVDMLAELREPHKFGVVKFSDDASKVEDLQILTPTSAKKINDAIRRTTVEKSTNLLAGIELGVQQQEQDTGKDPSVRAVFVFTDGKPFKGITDSDKIVARVKELVAKRPDIAIYTFALGTSIDFDLLRRIAEAGRGTLSIIERDDQMGKAFGQALGGIASQVGDNIKYTIIPKPGVTIISVMPEEGVTDGADGAKVIDLADLQEEEQRTVIINIKLDQSCLTNTPLEIHGQCTDSGTGLLDTDDTIAPPLKLEKVQQCVKNEEVIAETLRRGQFQRKYRLATAALNKGQTDEAAKQVEELLAGLASTKLTKKAEWLVKAEKDTEQLLQMMKTSMSSNKVNVLLLADTYGVADAIVKQRTGSINDKFESVGYVRTSAKAAMMVAATSAVSDVKPLSPFTLSSSEAASQKTTAGSHSSVDVMYTLKAPSIKGDRPPLSLTVVVDTSQSMSADAIKILVDTLKRLVEWIDSKNDANVLLGIITFGDTVNELLALSKFSAIDHSKVEKSFDAIQASGTAKIEDALKKGIDQQIPLANCRGSRSVFLLSNSASSSSSDSIAQTLKAQLGSSKSFVSIYTFALENADGVQMGKIAAAGNGQHYILQSPEDIPYSFGDAIGGLLGVSAKDVKVEFTPADKDIEIVSVFPGGESQGQGGFSTSALNVFEQEKIEFLVSVRFPASSSPASLLSISASYADASTCGTAESTVVSIGSGQKSSKSINKRRAEMSVASKQKEAADICMTATDIEDVRSINQEAYDIADITTAKTGRFGNLLLADIARISVGLSDVKKGTKSRSSVCAQLEALIDLLESERSKGTGKDNFYISEFYDSEIRRKSREEMAEGVVSTTACQEWTSAASQLQAQIRAWNGNTDDTDLYRSYTQSTEYRGRTSMHDVMAKILSNDVLEGHAAVGEAGMGALARMDDAIVRDDFSTALSEASTALQRMQQSFRNDDHDADTFAWHLIERSKKLVESVQTRCSGGYGSVAQQLDFMVDEAAKDKEVKPWMETEGSAWGAISFAY